MTRSFHELDTLRIDVTVTDAAGNPKDLTGATMLALIGGTAPASLPGAEGTVTNLDLPAGKVRLEFASDAAKGKGPRVTVQLRAQIAGEWQTPYEEEFAVLPSIRTA